LSKGKFYKIVFLKKDCLGLIFCHESEPITLQIVHTFQNLFQNFGECFRFRQVVISNALKKQKQKSTAKFVFFSALKFTT